MKALVLVKHVPDTNSVFRVNAAGSWVDESSLSFTVNDFDRYALEELRALTRKEVVFTLECSGNSGFEWFQGGIGNARWAGASLAEVLRAAGVKREGREVVFYGVDAGPETIPSSRVVLASNS